jgi:hypothetical protein
MQFAAWIDHVEMQPGEQRGHPRVRLRIEGEIEGNTFGELVSAGKNPDPGHLIVREDALVEGFEDVDSDRRNPGMHPEDDQTGDEYPLQRNDGRDRQSERENREPNSGKFHGETISRSLLRGTTDSKVAIIAKAADICLQFAQIPAGDSC